MAENEIVAMLGDIRSKMFDILSEEDLRNVLSVIDEKMDKYRCVSDKEIGERLIKKFEQKARNK